MGMFKKNARNTPTPKPLPKLSHKIPSLVRGMHDLLPEDEKYWRAVREAAQKTADRFGYIYMETPILEETGLFVRAVGATSDIVQKEMFSFTEPSGVKLSLRPEGTAGVARAYLQHGMVTMQQPVKLWYYGPFFRHERPQAGRYRQFHQLGLEVLGDGHPVLDADVMAATHFFYQQLGLPVYFEVNSLGLPQTRKNYRVALIKYYRAKKKHLCEDCVVRYAKNPLRLLDCKNPQCQELMAEAPVLMDALDEESKNHFTQVLEYADAANVPYRLNPFLVRGLDYYTKTVFEIFYDKPEATEPVEIIEGQEKKDEGADEKIALGGGGRYDTLLKEFSGREVPALGVGLGLERAVTLLKSKNIKVKLFNEPQIYFAQLGDEARKVAMKLVQQMRQADIAVAERLSKDGLKQQLEYASKIGVYYAIILGQKELIDGTLILRDMENGIQETINADKLLEEVQKRLSAKAREGLKIQATIENRVIDTSESKEE